MKPIKTQFKPVEPTGLGFCTTLHTKEPFKNLHRGGVNNATLILVLNPSVGGSHCIVGLQLSKKVFVMMKSLFAIVIATANLHAQ